MGKPVARRTHLARHRHGSLRTGTSATFNQGSVDYARTTQTPARTEFLTIRVPPTTCWGTARASAKTIERRVSELASDTSVTFTSLTTRGKRGAGLRRRTTATTRRRPPNSTDVTSGQKRRPVNFATKKPSRDDPPAPVRPRHVRRLESGLGPSPIHLGSHSADLVHYGPRQPNQIQHRASTSPYSAFGAAPADNRVGTR